jgi:hypothetical protein
VASVRVASCYDDDWDSLSYGDSLSKGADDVPRVMAAVDIRARHTAMSAEEVSRKFGVGLETARQTLKATTQLGIRHAIHPLSAVAEVLDGHNAVQA